MWCARASRPSASPPAANARAALLALAGLILSAPSPPALGVPAVVVRHSVLGRSSEGRAIQLTRIGSADAPVRVLVIGAIHGDELAGRAVVDRLRRAPPRLERRVALWLIDDLNPDGAAAGARQNAHGVDLNRNFPDGWRPIGSPGDTFFSGRRPLSEPESRLAARLIVRLKPDVTIWYHQALALVDLGTVADRGFPWRYARLSGLRAQRLGFLPGVATRWQNRTLGSGSSFVVELPAGALSREAVRRHVRAVGDAARHALANHREGSPGPLGSGARTVRR